MKKYNSIMKVFTTATTKLDKLVAANDKKAQSKQEVRNALSDEISALDYESGKATLTAAKIKSFLEG